MHKYKAHVPVEQYGFIEVESDDLNEVVTEYQVVKRAFGNEGWGMKEWADIRKKYLLRGEITPEDIEGCNDYQRYFINEVKKEFRRLSK